MLKDLGIFGVDAEAVQLLICKQVEVANDIMPFITGYVQRIILSLCQTEHITTLDANALTVFEYILAGAGKGINKAVKVSWTAHGDNSLGQINLSNTRYELYSKLMFCDIRHKTPSVYCNLYKTTGLV